MADLYANEHFPLQGVQRLRELGHDVLTSLEAGNANQSIPDLQVIEFAKRVGRALLTRNRRHFRRIHNADPHHFGIILCSDEIDFAGQAERIHAALVEAGDTREKLVQVMRPQRMGAD